MLAAVDRKGKVRVEEGEGKKKTVKDEKEGKRKAMAGREFNWGMLYMNVRLPYCTNITRILMYSELIALERCGGFVDSGQDEHI